MLSLSTKENVQRVWIIAAVGYCSVHGQRVTVAANIASISRYKLRNGLYKRLEGTSGTRDFGVSSFWVTVVCFAWTSNQHQILVYFWEGRRICDLQQSVGSFCHLVAACGKPLPVTGFSAESKCDVQQTEWLDSISGNIDLKPDFMPNGLKRRVKELPAFVEMQQNTIELHSSGWWWDSISYLKKTSGTEIWSWCRVLIYLSGKVGMTK